LISGANPHPKLQELASDKVYIAGWVDDIRESYCSARIFIAPMLINTGLQNKILESMSLRVPCISSRMANNAIKAMDGKHLLIASKPEEFAKKIQHLLENEHQAKRLAEEARKFVEENYTWEANNAKLNALISSK
jgi:glycosyltransferase involved in cell wall biosynthesis